MTQSTKIFVKQMDTKQQQMHISVSEHLIDKYNIDTNIPLQLSCGHTTIVVSITPIKGKEKYAMYCTELVLQSLYLPDSGLPIQFFYNKKTNTLTLGPIIALLLQLKQKNKSFSHLNEFSKEIATYCKQEHVYFYVFSISGWQDDYVEGHYYDGENWLTKQLPLPNAIYNRIHSRKYEKSEKMQALFEHFHRLNVPYYNDHFLNKWEVYEALSPFEQISPYLPDTRLMNGLSTLSEMLEHYSHIFLKPVHGSQGREIYRIQKKEDDSFFLDYTSFQQDIEQHYESLPSLYQSLRERLKTQRFIVQQGLTLMTYENRPLDFRVLCHKNNDETWQVISAVARVSGKNQFVSNLAKGGEMFKMQTVMLEKFDRETTVHLIKAVQEIAMEAASLISEESDGYFAELGIDLAVDEDGHPWLIEINTKPSKDSKDENLKIRPSTKAIIQHCQFLAHKAILNEK